MRLRPDVSASHVFGSRELSAAKARDVRAQEVTVDRLEAKHGIALDRQNDASGGMRFFLPAFARADRHATMITLAVPAGAGEIERIESALRVLALRVGQHRDAAARTPKGDRASRREDPVELADAELELQEAALREAEEATAG